MRQCDGPEVCPDHLQGGASHAPRWSVRVCRGGLSRLPSLGSVGPLPGLPRLSAPSVDCGRVLVPLGKGPPSLPCVLFLLASRLSPSVIAYRPPALKPGGPMRYKVLIVLMELLIRRNSVFVRKCHTFVRKCNRVCPKMSYPPFVFSRYIIGPFASSSRKFFPGSFFLSG